MLATKDDILLLLNLLIGLSLLLVRGLLLLPPDVDDFTPLRDGAGDISTG